MQKKTETNVGIQQQRIVIELKAGDGSWKKESNEKARRLV